MSTRVASRHLEQDPPSIFAPALMIGATLIAVLAAVWLRLVLYPDPDVAWLLTAADRMLAGAVLYRDIAEPNPPASVLLYVPAVVMARLMGLRATVACDCLVGLAVVASAALALRILSRGGVAIRWAMPVTVAVLLLLPLCTFGQREHIATVSMLPGLACLAVRRQGASPGRLPTCLSGVGLGVALAIKPIFGLALVGPLIELVGARPWRVALAAPELWIAGTLLIGYSAGVAVLAPDFATRMIPLLTAVYLPARMPWMDLVLAPVVWTWAGFAAAATLLRPSTGTAFGRMLLTASVGLEACYLLQGKGFPYHGLPAVLLAALSVGLRLVSSDAARATRPITPAAVLPATLALASAVAAFGSTFDIERYAPGLVAGIAGLATKPHVMTVGGDMPFGSSLADRAGGTWVGSGPSAWITTFARKITPRPETDPRFEAMISDERLRYAGDIVRAQPDALVVPSDAWLAWATSAPALHAALAPYVEVGRFGPARLLTLPFSTAGLRPSLGPDTGTEGGLR